MGCGTTAAGVASAGLIAPSAPGAPTLPQYPGLTPEEQDILQKQGISLDQFSKMIQGTGSQLQQNQQILQGISGLYNADGTVNQNALADLQQRSQQTLQQQGQAGQSALGYLQSLYGAGGALQSTQQAYTNALAGGAPANQQLEFTQKQNFNQMKEQAAQQGIEIQGDNWQNAVSKSTAGQKLIQNYQQNSNIQNQNYQLGYLNQLGTNMGQLSSVGTNAGNLGMNLAGNAINAPAGYAGQSVTQGQSALAPLLQSYQQQLSQYYQPYYMQQMGPYQQQMAQAQANYQGQTGQYNAQMGQIGYSGGIFMPAASFMGFGVNPQSGNKGLTSGVGGGGGNNASAGMSA